MINEELITKTVRSVLEQMNSSEMQKNPGHSECSCMKMTLHLAEKLAERIETRAKELGMRVVTAIADEGGNPKLMRSMDGAYIGSVDVAVNKAFTCVAFQMSTQKLSELAAPGAPLYGIQHTNSGRIVIFGGGEPLIINGRIIGALGVSGGTAEQDTALAAYGASVLKEVISCL